MAWRYGEGDPKDNPLHRVAGVVALHVWSCLYEGDYVTHHGPDEDELYNLVHDTLARALKDPEVRQELARALSTKDWKRRC